MIKHYQGKDVTFTSEGTIESGKRIEYDFSGKLTLEEIIIRVVIWVTPIVIMVMLWKI
jgi:hypothetical protein